MKLYTASEKNTRPVRLSEETRDFAYRSLHGEYGRDVRSHYAATLDHIPDFEALPPLEKYNIANLVHKHRNDTEIKYVPGISAFGREIDWSANRPAGNGRRCALRRRSRIGFERKKVFPAD